MAEMDLGNSYSQRSANDTRELTGDQGIKIQYTGPGSEVILQEGPPAGKTWEVEVRIDIKEVIPE